MSRLASFERPAEQLQLLPHAHLVPHVEQRHSEPQAHESPQVHFPPCAHWHWTDPPQVHSLQVHASPQVQFGFLQAILFRL